MRRGRASRQGRVLGKGSFGTATARDPGGRRSPRNTSWYARHASSPPRRARSSVRFFRIVAPNAHDTRAASFRGHPGVDIWRRFSYDERWCPRSRAALLRPRVRDAVLTIAPSNITKRADLLPQVRCPATTGMPRCRRRASRRACAGSHRGVRRVLHTKSKKRRGAALEPLRGRARARLRDTKARTRARYAQAGYHSSVAKSRASASSGARACRPPRSARDEACTTTQGDCTARSRRRTCSGEPRRAVPFGRRRREQSGAVRDAPPGVRRTAVGTPYYEPRDLREPRATTRRARGAWGGVLRLAGARRRAPFDAGARRGLVAKIPSEAVRARKYPGADRSLTPRSKPCCAHRGRVRRAASGTRARASAVRA